MLGVVPLPFRGIAPGRPYPPTGLTTARWAAEVPPVEVAFADLWLTQEHVSVAALWGHTDRVSDAFPHAVSWRDALFLEDGHHRIVRLALSGVDSTLMRVFPVD